MATDSTKQRRVLLVPSSGMGHLIPFVRLANQLSIRNISATILAISPSISSAETQLLSSLPSSSLLSFHLPPLPPSLFPPSSDPFFLQMEAFRRSVHLLTSLISSQSPPFSSLIIDIAIASTFLPIATLPCFVLFPSSASMLALCSAYPLVNIAGGILQVPKSSLPQPLTDPNHIFTRQFVENGRALDQATGILVNTFTGLEGEILAALNSGLVRPGLPRVIGIGPLSGGMRNNEKEKQGWLRWLDEQPERSVLYVCFGSRTAMSRVQIRELGAGLEMSGWRFLWVVKSAKVDREDEAEIGELLGEEYVRRVEGRGMVWKGWVEQEGVLGHGSVGGFFSHCGWNSVTEAAGKGVRVIGWPRMGDQRVNAEVVRRSGIGVWIEEWAWEGEEGVVVSKEKIADKVREVMGDQGVGERAGRVREMAMLALEEGGSSDQDFGWLLNNL